MAKQQAWAAISRHRFVTDEGVLRQTPVTKRYLEVICLIIAASATKGLKQSGRDKGLQQRGEGAPRQHGVMIHSHMHTRIHILMLIDMYVDMYVRMYICTFIYIYMRTFTHTYTGTCTCTRIFTCTSTFMPGGTNMQNTRAHAHTFTLTRTRACASTYDYTG